MKPAHKTLLSWVLLILMFLGIWQFLAPDRPTRPEADDPTSAERELPPSSQSSPLNFVVGLALIGGFIVVIRRASRQGTAATTALRASNEHELAGDLDAADRALEGFPDSPLYRRMAAAQRAWLALARGDLAAARAHAERGVGGGYGLFFRQAARLNEAITRGILAVLRAASGDADGARAEAAAVRAERDAPPIAIARAAFAEAIVLERAGDRAALGEHLQRERGILLEGLSARERTMVRAYERMLRASSDTVYRQQASDAPERTAADLALAAWVTKLSPAAAPFVREPSAAADPRGGSAFPLAPPNPAALTSARAARVPAEPSFVKRRAANSLLIWIGVFVFLALIFQLQGAWARHAGLFVVLGFFGFIAGAIALSTRRSRREMRALWDGVRLMSAGDLAGAARVLEPLVDRAEGMRAANARMLLAELAWREGTPALALERANAAMRHLAHVEAEQQRAAKTDRRRSTDEPVEIFTHQIELHRGIGEVRATALAALDRWDEAVAELHMLGSPPPELPVFRAGLVHFARRGDLAAAARLADLRSANLLISPRDEAIIALVRAALSPEPAHLERARAELASDPRQMRWIEAVAPALLTPRAPEPSATAATA